MSINQTQVQLEYVYTYGAHQSDLIYVSASSLKFHKSLWSQTCFELFVRDSETGQYWEWNFVPSGAWAAFAFSSERVRCFEHDELLEASFVEMRSQLDKQKTNSQLRLSAQIDLSFSSKLRWMLHQTKGLRTLEISLNALVLHKDQKQEYWAIQHANSLKADFHNPLGFVSLNQ